MKKREEMGKNEMSHDKTWEKSESKLSEQNIIFICEIDIFRKRKKYKIVASLTREGSEMNVFNTFQLVQRKILKGKKDREIERKKERTPPPAKKKES